MKRIHWTYRFPELKHLPKERQRELLNEAHKHTFFTRARLVGLFIQWAGLLAGCLGGVSLAEAAFAHSNSYVVYWSVLSAVFTIGAFVGVFVEYQVSAQRVLMYLLEHHGQELMSRKNDGQ